MDIISLRKNCSKARGSSLFGILRWKWSYWHRPSTRGAVWRLSADLALPCMFISWSTPTRREMSNLRPAPLAAAARADGLGLRACVMHLDCFSSSTAPLLFHSPSRPRGYRNRFLVTSTSTVKDRRVATLSQSTVTGTRPATPVNASTSSS